MIHQLLNDSFACTTSYVSREEVGLLLKDQEVKTKSLVDKTVSQLNSYSFTYDIIEVRNVAR